MKARLESPRSASQVIFQSRAKAQKDAFQSQLADLRRELEEYEALKQGAVSSIAIDSFDDLGLGLIKARIAAGLSQKALAKRLGIKEQQIQRYEAERYVSAYLVTG